MADRPADEISTLLNSYHSNTLSELALAAGLELMQGNKKLSKGALIAKMRAEFFVETRVRASWDNLNKLERNVLNRLLLRGSAVTKKAFRRELIKAGLATKAPEIEKPESPYSYYDSGVPYDRGVHVGKPTRTRSRIFEDVMARLALCGLVFSRGTPSTSGETPFKIQLHPAAILFVPDTVRRYLPEPEPIPSPLAGWQPERVESGAPAVFLRDLYIYWDIVRRNEVNLLKSGLVGKRWLSEINRCLLSPNQYLKDALREDQTGRLYLLRRLLEACKLVHRHRGLLRPVEKDPLRVPEFWGRPQTEQLAACLEAVFQLDELDELESLAGQYDPRWQHARRIVLTTLKRQPPGAWLETEDLLEEIQAQDVDFLFGVRSKVENNPSGRYHALSYGYYYGGTEALLATLDVLEAKFVSNWLTGFPHQIGVVELGYDSDVLVGYRLSPAGRAILGAEPAEPSSQPRDEPGKLVIQPNFQLLALGPVSLALLAQLDLFADRERADLGAFEYRLSRETVYRAQQMGMDVSAVLRFLEQHGNTDLPQNLRRSLEEWAAHHERIVFRTGVSLLQASGADLLVSLANDRCIGKHLARSVAADVSLVKQNHQEQLITKLVEQGLFPAVSGAQPESADRSVILRQDGTIHPIHAVPSLHLRGRLSRLAEEREDGVWVITPASVRRAGGSKAKVLRLLKELGRLHRGPLPTQLSRQIKAWGGYYGRAAAETLTLIEFHDRAALEELANHPDLKAYLTPFPTKDRALAVVPSGKLAQVKKILEQLGVQVTKGLQV